MTGRAWAALAVAAGAAAVAASLTSFLRQIDHAFDITLDHPGDTA